MMPDSTEPTSSSRGKMAFELSQYEKQNKNVSVHLNVRARNLDGKVTVVGTCDDYGPKMVGEKSVIPQEYTDKEAFKKYINDKIDSVYEAFSA